MRSITRNRLSNSQTVNSLRKELQTLKEQVSILQASNVEGNHLENAGSKSASEQQGRRTFLKLGAIAATGIAVLGAESISSKPALAMSHPVSSDFTNTFEGTCTIYPNNGFTGKLFDIHALPMNITTTAGSSTVMNIQGGGAGNVALRASVTPGQTGGIGIQAYCDASGSAIDINSQQFGDSYGARIFSRAGAIPLLIAPSDTNSLPAGKPVGSFFVKNDGSLWYNSRTGWKNLA